MTLLDPAIVRYERDKTRSGEVWLFTAHDEPRPFAMVEVFRADTQWGIRVQDTRPDLGDHDLLACVRYFLTWTVSCPVETVDVVLGRTHEHVMLLRVGGEYV
ncbi:MAG: hypothetical protein IT379_05150 [Deltaproteobacteria bacterium]|nr:hypothetical protein [Deltaproteobacteria bacterium]